MKEPLPDGLLESLYTAIGSVIVSWSFLETSLDACVMIIFEASGGKHIEDRIPLALNRKTRFLRKCFNNIDSLAGFSVEGSDLLRRVEDLAETRHFVAHGYLSEFRTV